jgi:hypothetical protein
VLGGVPSPLRRTNAEALLMINCLYESLPDNARALSHPIEVNPIYRPFFVVGGAACPVFLVKHLSP